MKLCPQTRCFHLEQLGALLREFIPPGCQSPACTAVLGDQVGRGTWGDPVLLRFRVGQPRASEGQRKLLGVGRAARCRAQELQGRAWAPPDSLGLLPVGGGKGLRQSCRTAPRRCVPGAGMCVAAEEPVPDPITIKPHQESANIQHTLSLQNAAFSY